MIRPLWGTSLCSKLEEKREKRDENTKEYFSKAKKEGRAAGSPRQETAHEGRAL